MFSQPRVPSVITLLLALSTSFAHAQGGDVLAQARGFASGGQRDDAIGLLQHHLESAPTDDDARSLLGTVLSWEGRYDEARGLLEQVLVNRPENTDVLSALMNLELWSGHPERAQRIADRGLKTSPNDTRFHEGRRRAAAAIDLVRPWEVSSGFSFDWFSDGRSAWRESEASLRRATSVGSVSIRASRAERFTMTDHQFGIEMYPRFRSGTYAYLAVGFAPDARLYPQYRYAADLYQSMGAGFEGSVGFRRLGFSSRTDIYVGTLSKYVGDWLFSGRMFYVPDRTGASSRSFHGSVRHYFGADGTDYAGVRYGRGLWREEIRSLNDFEVLSSDTIAAELQTAITRRLRLAFQGSSSRQDRLGLNGLRQHSVSASAGVPALMGSVARVAGPLGAAAVFYVALVFAAPPPSAGTAAVVPSTLPGDVNALLTAGRYADALPLALDLVRVFPGNHVYWRWLAAIYGELEQAKDESAAWEQFIRTSPSPFEACPQVVNAYRRQGLAPQAGDAADRCLSFAPDDPDMMFFAGLAAERLGQTDKAEGLYQQALTAAPDYLDASLGLARLGLHRSDLRGALKRALAALKVEPTAVDAMLVAGLALQRMGERSQARRYFERGLAVQEAYPDLHLGLGIVDEEDNNLDAARRHYERAVALDGSRADARDRLARLGIAAR